jgi:hypothetical protein
MLQRRGICYLHLIKSVTHRAKVLIVCLVQRRRSGVGGGIDAGRGDGGGGGDAHQTETSARRRARALLTHSLCSEHE